MISSNKAGTVIVSMGVVECRLEEICGYNVIAEKEGKRSSDRRLQVTPAIHRPWW